MAKLIIKFIFSAFVAFFMINCACFFYYNPMQSRTNVENYTPVKQKNKLLNVNSLEGFGIQNIDENGFNNEGHYDKESIRILCLGSSVTEAQQIDTKDNYVSGLNHKDGNIKAYNIGVSGTFFDKTIRYILVAEKEFPDVKHFIIETPHLPTANQLDDIVENKEIKNTNYDWRDQGIIGFFRSMPWVRLIKTKIEDSSKKSKPKEEQEKIISDAEYEYKLDSILKNVNSQLGSKTLMILYLPPIEITNEPGIVIHPDKQVMIFEKVCKNNNIIFISMGEKYLEEYRRSKVIPYGFSNSHIGLGHPNVYGHQMIAEELYSVIKNEGWDAD